MLDCTKRAPGWEAVARLLHTLHARGAAFARGTYDVRVVWQQLQVVYRAALALKARARGILL